MVATIVNLISASSTVHYSRREGHGLGAPANDPGSSASSQGQALPPGSSPRQAGTGDEAEDYYTRRDHEHRKAGRWRGSGATADAAERIQKGSGRGLAQEVKRAHA